MTDDKQHRWQNSRFVVILLLKLAVAVVLIAVATREVSWPETLNRLLALDTRYLLLAALVMTVQIAFMSIRLHTVMVAIHHPAHHRCCLRAVGGMLAFNPFLPAGIGGDGARIWILSAGRLDTVKLTTVGIAIDRVVALFGLVVLIALLLPPTATVLGTSGDPLARTVLSALILAIAVTAVGWLIVVAVRIVPAWLVRWRLGEKIVRVWGTVRQVLARPQPALGAVGLAMMAHVMSIAAILALCRAAGVDAPALTLAALTTPVLLLINIPVSIGGWGLREAGMVSALAIIAVPAEPAFLVGAVFGLLQLGQAAVGGLILMMVRPSAKHAAAHELA